MSRKGFFQFLDKRGLRRDSLLILPHAPQTVVGLELGLHDAIGDKDVFALVKLLEDAPECTRLDLRHCAFGEKGNAALAALFERKAFTHFTLRDVTPDAAMAIAKAVEGQRSLMHFELGFMHLSSAEVAIALAKSLRPHRSLASLCLLPDWAIQQAGLKALAEAVILSGNLNLSFLQVSGLEALEPYIRENYDKAFEFAERITQLPNPDYGVVSSGFDSFSESLTNRELEEIELRRGAIMLFDDPPDRAASFPMQKEFSRHYTLLHALAKEGGLMGKLLKRGRATPLLRTCTALGLLPELGRPEFWKNPAEGLTCWRAIREVMPPLVRQRMDEIDITALSHAGRPEPEPSGIFRYAERKSLTGFQR